MDATAKLFIELDVLLSFPELPTRADLEMTVTAEQRQELVARGIEGRFASVERILIPPKLRKTEVSKTLQKAILLAKTRNVADMPKIRMLIFEAHQALEEMSGITIPKNPVVERMKAQAQGGRMDATTRLFLRLSDWLSNPDRPRILHAIPFTDEQKKEKTEAWQRSLLSFIARTKISPKLRNAEVVRTLKEAILLAQTGNVAALPRVQMLITKLNQVLGKKSTQTNGPKEDFVADCVFSFPASELRDMLDDPPSMFKKSSQFAGNEERIMCLEDSLAIIRHLISKASKARGKKDQNILDSGTQYDLSESEFYRIYQPDEVAKIATKLKATSFASLADVFEVQDMFECARGIEESEVDSTLEAIAYWYDRLTKFFKKAAKLGYCVLAF